MTLPKNPDSGTRLQVNVFKNMRLRTKLIGSFVLFALIAGIVSYVGLQLVFEDIRADAIPTLAVVGQITTVAKAIQTEVIEFVAAGEEESIEEFGHHAGELEALSEQLKTDLADDPDEVEGFEKLVRLAGQGPVLGQQIIGSHRQTLAQLEALQELEEKVEGVFEEANDLIEARGSISAQRYLREFMDGVRLLHTETLEFAVSGENEAVEEFEAAEARLEAAQEKLATLLEADASGEAELIDKLDEIEEALETEGRGVLETHAKTLSLLEELEELEEELHQATAAAQLLVDQDISEGVAESNSNIMIASGAALVLAIILGLLIANTIVRPVYQLVEAARQIGAGDLTIQARADTRDEIGELAGSFNRMTDSLRQMAQAATRLAQGDVAVDVTPRSEQDVLGQAFSQMIIYQQQMAQAADRLAQGDVAVDVTSQSEQDVLGQAFSQMILYQQQMAQAANRLAQGDVAVEVTPQSEQDVLGNAFSQMILYQQQMAQAAGRLAQGDVAVEVRPQSEQDVLGQAFSQMVVYQQQMAQVASHLAQGDLSGDVTAQSEQDVLGNAFSQMLANLRRLIGQAQQSAAQVATASQQLNAAANQAGQASRQVAATIQQVAEGAAQQTQAVITATGNVEQIARAADGIAQGAQEQASGVQKTSSLIDEMAMIVGQVGQVAVSVTEANSQVSQAARHGVKAVEQSSQGMETIRGRTVVAAEKVKEMSLRSKEIGRIVDTIDTIADKTDMLALNAAVEAARAGEHGRGFAVVADQVRKLSEDSKEATRDITALIERVQETVSEAIGAMESTRSEVEQGSRLASETAQALGEILRAAEGAAELAEAIGQAVGQLKQKSEGVVAAIEGVSAVVEENTAVAEEMAANTQEATIAMDGVASVAEENSASAEEVSASAEEMSAQVEEMVASVEELAELAEQLRAATAQFRLQEPGWAENGQGGGRAKMAGVAFSPPQPELVSAPINRPKNNHQHEAQ